MRNDGTFEASDIVAAARPKSSPIHDMFEWDNSLAAERYREEQARGYVRKLVVEYRTNGSTTQMPMAISLRRGDGYTSMITAMSDKDLRASLVKQALIEADQWMRRYQHLEELAIIFAQIKKHVG